LKQAKENAQEEGSRRKTASFHPASAKRFFRFSRAESDMLWHCFQPTERKH
jgi:hypothetical protein